MLVKKVKSQLEESESQNEIPLDSENSSSIKVFGARVHNLKNISLKNKIKRLKQIQKQK